MPERMHGNKRLIDATAECFRETDKIKTHFAKIIVEGSAENPYYSILYYDHTAKEYYNGYGSYNIANVFKWLSGEFEIVDAPTVDAVEVVHGRWEQVQRWATKAKYRCSVCGREIMSAVSVNIEKYPYCHCGAKMDGGNEDG